MPNNPQPLAQPDRTPKLAYSVQEAAKAISISEAEMWRRLNAGELPAVTHGERRTLILHDALIAYLAALPPWQPVSKRAG